ncbi:IS5/IS1182 family transposase, partial [Streptomyces sp. NPDC088135]
PRRWVVERTFGWLMHHRRLARDYETQVPYGPKEALADTVWDLVSSRLG